MLTSIFCWLPLTLVDHPCPLLNLFDYCILPLTHVDFIFIWRRVDISYNQKDNRMMNVMHKEERVSKGKGEMKGECEKRMIPAW